MRIHHVNPEDQGAPSEPMPFPSDRAEVNSPPPRTRPGFDLTCLPESAEQVLEAIEDMSRRIDHLARELNCLGHFDDDDDSPRAA